MDKAQDKEAGRPKIRKKVSFQQPESDPAKKPTISKFPKPATPAKPIQQKPNGSDEYIETDVAFYYFFVAHIVAAFYSPILDCDEVFNYWEPTHYLNYGSGLQTWEYSPDYAIRSWAYASIQGVIVLVGRLIPFPKSKTFQFYFLRVALGFLCAMAESKLFTKVSQTMNARLGMIFMFIMLVSPGMFHASVAYLPSSFTMYTTMLGIASFMDWRGGIRTAQGIFWIGFGSVLGWPFAGAMVLPFLAEELLIALLGGQAIIELATRVMYGTTRTILTGAVQMGIDGFFYRKVAVVSFNIVKYNVLAARDGKGPNIYGTEPWHFYIRNLLINFNIWFLLALAAMPLVLLQHFGRQKPVTKMSHFRIFFLLMPFYLWLAIFTLQPHKEERFMYPAYPALALNAAVTVHILLSYLGSSNKGRLANPIPAEVRLGFVGILFGSAALLGLLRTVGMVTAYNAPLSVYKPLREPGMAKSGDHVCLGKEWYRFPSSFHLPSGVKPKFIKSEFSGLLPGEFSEARKGFGLFPGAWLVPSGMNDENTEDPGKHISIDHCHFLVDSSLPGQPPTKLEPDHVHDTEHWEQIECVPFLDTANTGTLGRLIWTPEWDMIPPQFRRQWGEYCLLRRKDRQR